MVRKYLCWKVHGRSDIAIFKKAACKVSPFGIWEQYGLCWSYQLPQKFWARDSITGFPEQKHCAEALVDLTPSERERMLRKPANGRLHLSFSIVIGLCVHTTLQWKTFPNGTTNYMLRFLFVCLFLCLVLLMNLQMWGWSWNSQTLLMIENVWSSSNWTRFFLL